MLAVVCLVLLYILIAIVIGENQWPIAAYIIPCGIVGLLTSVRRIVSPYLITLVGLLAYVGVMVGTGVTWTIQPLLIAALHSSIMIVTGLVLSEIQILATSARAEEDSVLQQQRFISLSLLQQQVATEMRRGRRTEQPLSIALFRKRDGQERDGLNQDGQKRYDQGNHTRSELINSVMRDTREFDYLFSLSRNELGVICTDTNKPAAASFAARIAQSFDLESIATVTFPDDAVTSSDLIRLLTKGETQAPQQKLEVVLD